MNVEKIFDMALQAGANEVAPRDFLLREEQLVRFAQLIQTECMAICEATKADYLKSRKAAFDFEEKEIFAEGEAASDAIKYQIAYMFGPK